MKRVIYIILTILISTGCNKIEEIEVVENQSISMTELIPSMPIIYYRSINSEVYHVEGCMYLNKILDENLVEFTEVSDDLRRCNVCKYLN